MKRIFTIFLLCNFFIINNLFASAKSDNIPILPPQGLVETTSCPITSVGNSSTPEPGDSGIGGSSLFLHNIWARKNPKVVENIVNDLNLVKDKLEKSSGTGRLMSRKIKVLVNKLAGAFNKPTRDCNSNIALIPGQIEKVISQISTRKCSESEGIKKKCIPSLVVDEATIVLQDTKHELETLLSNDNNKNQIVDICEASVSSSNSNTSNNNPGKIPELTGAFVKQIPNRFVVLFSEIVTPFNTRTVVKELEEKFKLDVKHVYPGNFQGVNLVAPEGVDVAELLKDNPNIKEVLHDYAFKIDDYNRSNETVEARIKYQVPYIDVQTIPPNIKWIEADKNPNEGAMCKVTVAVIDSGIDYNHPDLRDNINRELSVNCLVHDQYGNCLPDGEDDNGHGTEIAGIIAAQDNNIGVLGVGSKIELISVKVLDHGGVGTVGNLIAGLNYVGGLSSEIEIANISLGAIFGKTPTQEQLDLIKVADDALYRAINGGVIFVVAAGNENLDVEENYVYPAKNPSVITVSALTDDNGIHNDGDETWAFFGIDPLTMETMSSNFGLGVDIIAPGTKIISTELGGGYSLPLRGTSYAAPHVAGTIGLFIAKNGRPQSAEKNFLRPLFKAITKDGKLHRDTPYPNEPADGFLEPAIYANGPLLQP